MDKPLCEFCSKPSSNNRLHSSEFRSDVQVCWACKQREKRAGELVLPPLSRGKKRKESSKHVRRQKRKLSTTQEKHLRAMLESESEESDAETPLVGKSESFAKMSVKLEEKIVLKKERVKAPRKTTKKQPVFKSKDKKTTKKEYVRLAPAPKSSGNGVISDLKKELAKACQKVTKEFLVKDQKIAALETALMKRTNESSNLIKRMKKSMESVKQEGKGEVEAWKAKNDKQKDEIRKLVQQKLHLAERLEIALTENLILKREISGLRRLRDGNKTG